MFHSVHCAALSAGETSYRRRGEPTSREPLTFDGGLRHLLHLRALTSLQLPWMEPREVEALRELAEQTGRTSLHIERIVPLRRRSLLQRHWIDSNEFGD